MKCSLFCMVLVVGLFACGGKECFITKPEGNGSDWSVIEKSESSSSSPPFRIQVETRADGDLNYSAAGGGGINIGSSRLTEVTLPTTLGDTAVTEIHEADFGIIQPQQATPNELWSGTVSITWDNRREDPTVFTYGIAVDLTEKLGARFHGTIRISVSSERTSCMNAD